MDEKSKERVKGGCALIMSPMARRRGTWMEGI